MEIKDSLPEAGSSYIGHHAELYDLFYADKPYAEEAAFVHACLQKYGNHAPKHILELACGTGTHSLLLEKYGYDIIATDYSKDMLAQARQKANKNGAKVNFRQQDMRFLNIPERPFDAVICLFDSIGYVATNENIQQVLKGVRAHLCPGGLFIFEFWHAGAMIRNYDPVRIRRWEVPDGEILRISETRIDHQRQLCHVTYSIYELHKDGTYHHFRETQVNRFFLLQEMAHFLLEANLTPLKWFAGFSENENITEEVWHIVGIAHLNSKMENTP
jgi:ubiquinone/menaquinone biosynthesis C-methylase UbiE